HCSDDHALPLLRARNVALGGYPLVFVVAIPGCVHGFEDVALKPRVGLLRRFKVRVVVAIRAGLQLRLIALGDDDDAAPAMVMEVLANRTGSPRADALRLTATLARAVSPKVGRDRLPAPANLAR